MKLKKLVLILSVAGIILAGGIATAIMNSGPVKANERTVKKAVVNNLRDILIEPDSLEIISVSTMKGVTPEDFYKWYSVIEYRSKNSFGGYVRGYVRGTVFVNHEGEINGVQLNNY